MFFLNAEIKLQNPTFETIMSLDGPTLRAVKERTTKRITLNGKHYFIKKHHGTQLREIIKNFLQLRLPIISARNEFLAIERLQKKGLAVPKILGYGDTGLNPLTRRSFVILEAIEPSISLESLTAKWKDRKPSFTFKKTLLVKIAEMTATMHSAGVNHRDLYICHFLLKEKNLSKQESLPLYLIDFHRAQIRNFVPMRWRIKDLAGLYFSSKDIGLSIKDLFRFMKYYSGKSLRHILDKDKNMWTNIYLRGERLYRDHQ